jgi:Flp pilus assembly protein TadD
VSTISSTAAPRSQGWIVSPWWDLAYVVITPLAIVPVVLILVRQFLTPEQVSLAVISFASLGHHLPGFMRAYGDQELFKRYPWRFLAVPPLVFAIALLFSPPTWLASTLHLPWKHLHGLELILLVWGTWHGLMQTYGFMRIYDVKRGVNDRWSARLDHWLCLMVFVTGVVFSDARVFAIAKSMWESGLPVFGPQWLIWIRIGVGAISLLVLAAYIVNLVRQVRAGQPVSWVKLLLIATTGWFYWYTGRLSVNVLIGIAMFEIFHAVQYYAIVWVYNRRLFQRAGEKFGPLGFLFSDRWTMLGLYLAAIGAYSSIRFFTVDANAYIFSGTSEDVYQWLVALFVTSSFLHFYFDGFIWKVSERKTQENLVDAPLETAPAILIVPGFAHAAKWAVLLAIISSLLLAERARLRNPTSNDLRKLAALAALTPDLPECQAMLCRDALSRGDAETAIAFGEKAIKHRESSHTAHADLGLAYLQGNRLIEAKQQFVEAARIAPDQWAHHCDLGIVLAKLGDDKQAEVELKLAAEMAPGMPEPHEVLAEFYLDSNRNEEAEKLYVLIDERFPDSLSAELGKIALLNCQGKFVEAIERAKFLSAGHSDDWRVMLALGSSLNASGAAADAMASLEQAVRIRPESAEARYQLALAQFRLQQYPQTLGSLTKALQLDPQHFAAQMQLANTYYVLGEIDTALQTFQKALDIRPGDPTASANYGGLLAQLGMPEEAEKVYRQSLVSHGDSQQLNFNLGILLWQSDKKSEAKKLILRAEELGMQLPTDVKAALEEVQ